MANSVEVHDLTKVFRVPVREPGLKASLKAVFKRELSGITGALGGTQRTGCPSTQLGSARTLGEGPTSLLTRGERP